jgi:DNA-binding CsgD family transcriptional regulator
MNTNATLTPRESEIAECLAWGYSKKEIASKKFISVHTVETTSKHIYRKTGVGSVGRLAAWWFCKKFDISVLRDPLLASLFMMLCLVNEFNTDDTALRAKSRTGRVVKTSKGKRNDTY